MSAAPTPSLIRSQIGSQIRSHIRSMTGFGSAELELPDGRSLNVSIKAVNHRHLDLTLRLPGGLDALEPAIRQAVKAAVRRGHVEVTLALTRGQQAAGLVLDEAVLAAYSAAHRRAAGLLGLPSQPDVDAMLRLPGVLVAAGTAAEDGARLEAPCAAALHAALAKFEAARLSEGAALAHALRAGMQQVAQLAAEAATLRAGVAAAEFTRLKTKMAALLEGVAVSEERLLTEAALLAGRGDIEEELVRLRTHIDRFVALLEAGGEAGRALDFLLQEMNREANTALSKTGASAGEAGLRLTELGLAIKGELERAREQVQNLE